MTDSKVIMTLPNYLESFPSQVNSRISGIFDGKLPLPEILVNRLDDGYLSFTNNLEYTTTLNATIIATGHKLALDENGIEFLPLVIYVPIYNQPYLLKLSKEDLFNDNDGQSFKTYSRSLKNGKIPMEGVHTVINWHKGGLNFNFVDFLSSAEAPIYYRLINEEQKSIDQVMSIFYGAQVLQPGLSSALEQIVKQNQEKKPLEPLSTVSVLKPVQDRHLQPVVIDNLSAAKPVSKNNHFPDDMDTETVLAKLNEIIEQQEEKINKSVVIMPNQG